MVLTPFAALAMLDRVFVLAPLNVIAGNFLLSMKDYTPGATPGSFNLEKTQKQIEASTGGQIATHSVSVQK
jgi:arylsulfatase